MTETREIPVGGLGFTVDLAGPMDGSPVLLLHGFPETRHMWRHQLDVLGRRGFRAIAPDQRGYSAGARPEGVDAYATGNLVADALGLMNALGAPRFHLIGHDWGGQLAWLIAAHHPARIRSLTALSRPHPAAFVRAMAEDAAQAERSRHHRAFREEGAVARMREAKLKPLREALLAQGVPPADAAIYLDTLMQSGAIEGAMAWYRATGLAAAETPPVSAPTLYVWGDSDATVGRRAAELTAEYVTGPYRFVTMEGTGHFLVDQYPDRVSTLILEHLRESGAAS
jgi:pimeloyl-ACP methyl ester carboxylesterase